MKHPETARRINEALNLRGISAKELSDRSGVSQSSLSQYINGSHAPSNFSAKPLANVLKVNPMWLMGFEVNRDLVDDIVKEYQDKLAKLPRDKQEKVFSYIDAMIDLEG